MCSSDLLDIELYVARSVQRQEAAEIETSASRMLNVHVQVDVEIRVDGQQKGCGQKKVHGRILRQLQQRLPARDPSIAIGNHQHPDRKHWHQEEGLMGHEGHGCEEGRAKECEGPSATRFQVGSGEADDRKPGIQEDGTDCNEGGLVDEQLVVDARYQEDRTDREDHRLRSIEVQSSGQLVQVERYRYGQEYISDIFDFVSSKI
mgnify:CR=1 FL=1